MNSFFKVRQKRYGLLSLLSLGFIFIAWCVLTYSTSSHPAFVTSLKLPSPLDVLHSALSTGPKLLEYSFTTFGRVIAGLLIGVVFGIGTGLLLSASKILDSLLTPLIEAIRPCPVIALTPWVILWLGLGTAPQIFMVSLGSFLVMTISTYSQASGVESRYIQAAQSLGADSLMIRIAIIFPEILPALSGAIRVSSATCFGIAVAAEYLGAEGGLGFLIRNARSTLNTDTILLGIIILGLESYLLDKIIQAWGKSISRWRDSHLNFDDTTNY